MPRRFREEPAKLWMLSVGSPFPQEIAIRRINKFHFGFVPSTDTVKPSVFKEVNTVTFVT